MSSSAHIQNGPRRLFLRYALASVGAVAAAGAAGFELVNHGVLPGKATLDRLDGACSVPPADLAFYAPPGQSLSGTFYSAARHRTVGYTIAYPPAHRPGHRLPLVVMLHGYGGDHANAVSGMTPAQALALSVGGQPLPPMAMVTVDGGGGYWNPHPGDDPMGMLTRELTANAGAYASAADFAADDAVTHAAALAHRPVRVAAGYSDPFYSGVRALAAALPAGAVVDFGNGCHDGSFFNAAEPPSLEFLGRHLSP